jgi:hypothetical protein
MLYPDCLRVRRELEITDGENAVTSSPSGVMFSTEVVTLVLSDC